MTEAPTPPFIHARDFTEGGNLPVRRIVIHGTVSPCRCGGAESIAQYFQSPTYQSSCHYVVDPCETYQCVNDQDVAWHAPPNEHSIGVELCDPQKGPDSRWDDADHEAMLDRAADLTRQLCEAYDVPMVWLMPEDLRAGARGITDHENVGIAWGQTSHTDPGWSTARSDDFIRRVTHTPDNDRSAPEKRYDDMGLATHWLPQTNGEWSKVAFSVECGDTSAMIDQLWMTVASAYGSTDIVTVFEGYGEYQWPSWIKDGFSAGSWDGDTPNPGSVPSGQSFRCRLTPEMEVVSLYYRNNGNAAVGVSFPQTIK